MKTLKQTLCFVVAIALVITLMTNTVEAATRVKLNKKKVTLTITNSKKNPTTTLKVKGVSKKVAKKAKWSTSRKSVAMVKKGKITAKKAGKATITCKVKGKKYTCKVTVVDKRRPIDTTPLEIRVKKMSENGDTVKSDPNGGDIWIQGKNTITVTYGGEDVTQKATYKSSDPTIGYVKTPGIIELGKWCGEFNLTVSYNGVTKTIRLQTQKIVDEYTECYCGVKFYDKIYGDYNDSTNKHYEHVITKHCGGCYYVPYVRYLDFVIVK